MRRCPTTGSDRPQSPRREFPAVASRSLLHEALCGRMSFAVVKLRRRLSTGGTKVFSPAVGAGTVTPMTEPSPLTCPWRILDLAGWRTGTLYTASADLLVVWPVPTAGPNRRQSRTGQRLQPIVEQIKIARRHDDLPSLEAACRALAAAAQQPPPPTGQLQIALAGLQHALTDFDDPPSGCTVCLSECADHQRRHSTPLAQRSRPRPPNPKQSAGSNPAGGTKQVGGRTLPRVMTCVSASSCQPGCWARPLVGIRNVGLTWWRPVTRMS